MPTFVRTEKCDSCKGQDKTACMYICPHNLMKLDKDGSETGHAMKAFNQEPEQCWECYSCVKIKSGGWSRGKIALLWLVIATICAWASVAGYSIFSSASDH